MTPPARLPRLRPHRTNVLVVGGSAEQRLQAAYAIHREGSARPGPFVCLDSECDEARLRRGLESRISLAGPIFIGDPLGAAETGTLFLDSIAGLSPDAQRILLAFLQQQLDGQREDVERWSGRLIAGNAEPLSQAVRDGRFLAALFDALDKVRVELPAGLEEHVA